MKNKLIPSLSLIALLALIGCAQRDGDSRVVSVIDLAPTFKKTEGVRFTAYAGPTVSHWTSEGSCPNTITDRNMKMLADAGFNKILALYEGGGAASGSDTFELIKNRSKIAERDAMMMLEYAEKYNIKYIIRDWSFYGLVKNYTYGYNPNILTDEDYKQVIDDMFTSDNPYIKSKAFGGNFTHDEPTYEELDRIAVQVKYYYEAMDRLGIKGADAVVNLYPCHVSTAGLSKNGDKTYEDYVDHYFDLITPQTGFACFDFYPYLSDPYDGSYMRPMHLLNLNMFAERCKEKNVELRGFIQSVGNWTGMRPITSAGDFRLEIYSQMAFGSHEFIYYEYANSYEQGTDDFALLNCKDYDEEGNPGVYNYTYDLAKTVNNEVHAFEDAYLAYKWDGIMFKNAKDYARNYAFTFIDDEAIKSHPRVSFKECTEDAIMGTFKNKENGDDAFMLVNYVDPYFQKNNEVTLHFNDARGLLMYRMGQRMVVDLPESGDYTFVLYPGEGRFIIPIK